MITRTPGAFAICWLVVLGVLPQGACRRGSDASPPAKPIVYCSVDEVFSRGVLDGFTRRTGIELAVIFDSEAGKTTGLVNRIISDAEAGRPRADVFWSNEVFNTILLAGRGLLEPYASPTASDIPPRFKDPQNRWTAVAARARVLAFDPTRTARAELPATWEALAEPRIAEQLAVANPLFGTTRGHIAAMFALWGPNRGRAFLAALRDGGAQIVDSNSASVRAVIAGRVKLGATDSDDVWMARRSGTWLELIYPDMGDGGTLLIPCSVAIVKGTRNPAAARMLVDFLVSAEVERLLAESDSRNIPVRDALRSELGLEWPPESKLGFDAVAAAMEDAVAAVREILIR